MTTPTTPLVITATPTLFHDDESLNGAEITRHLHWLKEKGVDAIFPAGTSGEFPTLSDDERIEILDRALEVFGPENVYLHTGAASANRAEEIVRRAVEHGVGKMAAVTPFFQPAPEQQVLDYYARLVDAASGADVFAYLFEARTTTISTPSILPKLAALGVAGVKLSGETDASVDAYIAQAPAGFTVFSGNDVSFGRLIQSGGHGIVSGVSSAFPEPFIALRDALIAGNEEQISVAQNAVDAAVRSVQAGSLTHLKAGISSRGFAGGTTRTAVAPTSDADLAVISSIAATLDGE